MGGERSPLLFWQYQEARVKRQGFFQRRPSRRAVLIGLTGLTTVGIVGGALALVKTSSQHTSGKISVVQSTATPFLCLPDSLSIAGTSTLQPLVQIVAKDYQTKCPGAIITVDDGGTSTGFAQLESGLVQIANTEISKAASQKDLVDYQVTAVVYALVVNKNVTGVTSLSIEQLRGMYSGQILNWKQVGGPDLPIILHSRPTISPVRKIFERYVLEEPITIVDLPHFPFPFVDVLREVQYVSGALGYTNLQSTWPANVRTLQLNGLDPIQVNVASNAYPFWSIGHMYTKGKATGLAQALIDYMQSDSGRAAIQKLKFLPIDEIPREALATRQL